MEALREKKTDPDYAGCCSPWAFPIIGTACATRTVPLKSVRMDHKGLVSLQLSPCS